MKFELELSDKQFQTILNALDLYGRLGTGQLKILVEVFNWHYGLDCSNKDVMNYITNIIHKLYFSDLSTGSSYGIFSDKTPDQCKIAYDLIQVLRNVDAWNKNPGGGFEVNFFEPMQCGNENLCKMKIIDENEEEK